MTSNSAFSDGNGPLVYTSVGCAGHEKRFSDCSKSNYFRATCSRRNTVGVYCWDGEFECFPFKKTVVGNKFFFLMNSLFRKLF